MLSLAEPGGIDPSRLKTAPLVLAGSEVEGEEEDDNPKDVLTGPLSSHIDEGCVDEGGVLSKERRSACVCVVCVRERE